MWYGLELHLRSMPHFFETIKNPCYACIYIYIYVCVCIYMCVYIYMYTRVLQVCVWFGGGKQLAARLMPRKQPTFVLAKSGAKLPTTPREKSKLAR